MNFREVNKEYYFIQRGKDIIKLRELHRAHAVASSGWDCLCTWCCKLRLEFYMLTNNDLELINIINQYPENAEKMYNGMRKFLESKNQSRK